MARSRVARLRPALGVLPFGVYLVIFLVVPTVTVIIGAFVDAGRPSLTNLAGLFDPSVLNALLNSVLVSALTALAGGSDALWVCAALKDTDRRVARAAPGGRLDLAGHDTGGHAVRMLAIDPGTYHRAYNEVANATLWFLHHLLFDTPQRPAFDAL